MYNYETIKASLSLLSMDDLRDLEAEVIRWREFKETLPVEASEVVYDTTWKLIGPLTNEYVRVSGINDTFVELQTMDKLSTIQREWGKFRITWNLARV